MKFVLITLLALTSINVFAAEKINVTIGHYPMTIEGLIADAQDILLDKANTICKGFGNVQSLKGVNISIRTWDFAEVKLQNNDLLLNNPNLTVTALLECKTASDK